MFLQCQHFFSVCKFKSIRRIAIFTLNLIVGLSVFEAHSAEKFTNSEKVEIKKLMLLWENMYTWKDKRSKWITGRR